MAVVNVQTLKHVLIHIGGMKHHIIDAHTPIIPRFINLRKQNIWSQVPIRQVVIFMIYKNGYVIYHNELTDYMYGMRVQSCQKNS